MGEIDWVDGEKKPCGCGKKKSATRVMLPAVNSNYLHTDALVLLRKLHPEKGLTEADVARDYETYKALNQGCSPESYADYIRGIMINKGRR